MSRKEEYYEDLVKEICADFARRQEERRPLELQWRLNMNFLIGNQYAEITPTGDVEDYGKQYFWQQREVYNHIAPIIETRIAKLIRVKASVSVRPFTSDEDDMNTAKLSTQVLKSITEDNKLTELVTDGNMWSEVCGSCFYKVVWNSDKGRVLGKTRKGEIREGDVEICLCPPYEIYPDSIAASSIDDCRSIIHAKAYHVDDIKDKYGVEVEGGKVNLFSLDNARVTGGLGYSGTVPSVITASADDHAVVIERYERPNKEFPRGRFTVVAGGLLLYDGELPYVNGKDGGRIFPFARQCAVTCIGNFFGSSIIERCIPLQRDYNSVKNRKHEFMNRIAMGVLAVEDGSVDTDNLEEEGLSPGKVLIYRQGARPPMLLDPGTLPSDFSKEEDRILDEFMIISGVSEFMRSTRVPANISSGVALSILQEQDDTRISLTADSIRACVRSIGEMILRLYKSYADNKRLVRISGESGEVTLKYFRASDLKCDDLVFDTDNELSDTPANRKSMVYDLIKMGLLNDDKGNMSSYSKLKALEMLGFGNWESTCDIADMHRRKAERENADMSFDLTEVDDHALHVKEHTKAVIGGKITEEEKRALLAHIGEHKLLAPIGAEEETYDRG